jgi:GlpG protein
MRQIGHIADEKQAHVFGDHLVANRIRNEIEADENAWVIWILDEEQVADAKARLERFRANPAATEFVVASSQAAKARDAEARDLGEYQKRVRTGRSLFPKMGGYGVGPLTFVLIFICVLVAFFTKLGFDHDTVRRLLLADPEFADRTFLAQVRAGEFWRLITPIFVHFGPLHLLFNMMWLYQLGCMIEARQGTLILGLLVAVTGILPMVAEYIVMGGPGYVGGMSGAIYGLAGYVWMRGKYDRASGLFLDRQNIQWLLIWLVLCFTGLLGNVANAAHVTGLVIGVIWGRASAYFATRRSG